MKKLVLGSLNIDRVYQVHNIVRTGETILSYSYTEFCGGKGLNQAIALARAGSQVFFSGAVGEDGKMLTDMLAENNINNVDVMRLSCTSGHAIIQVDEKGKNCIIVCPAANGEIGSSDIDCALSGFNKGDLIVLQNEISNSDYAIRHASEIGMIVALNPSPITSHLMEWPIELVDYLVLNEHEGAMLAKTEDPCRILTVLSKKFPKTSFVLTLGRKGAIYMGKDGVKESCGAINVNAIDTTAAGDTFVGYFLHEITEGRPPQQALHVAAVASGISVTRKGAEPSIPRRAEVNDFLTQADFLMRPQIICPNNGV